MTVIKMSRIYLYLLIFTLLNSCIGMKITFGNDNEKNYFDVLTQKLVKNGFKEDQIKAIYDDQKTKLALTSVALFFSHNESQLNYDQFLSKREIKKAQKYLKKHNEILTKVEKEYGVKKTIITAVALVETRLGTYLGGSSILNTLSTLSAIESPELKEMVWEAIPEKRRIDRETFERKVTTKSKWAYKELQAYLTYVFKEGIEPASIKGSYAGAIGISQFMPTNILAYAKDGNNDGRIDLFDHQDAIASIASYLKHYGWKPGISDEDAYKVLYYYNHSKYYVDTLLKISKELEG
ncbi:MAG: lytic murein transglycosylase [Proteobacteria bacterium]|nr:lytic murein transglycosylase [Pseudomonadota bacterium]